VGLRRLQDASGAIIEPGDAFRAYRDGTKTTDPTVEERRAHMQDVLKSLDGAGVKAG